MTAVATLPNPHDLVVDLWAASPFAGLTIEQGWTMNAVLPGLPVEVAGGRFEPDALNVYIFDGLMLPGMWRRSPFDTAGTLVLTEATPVEHHGDVVWIPRSGSARHIGAALVRHFRVLALDVQWQRCETCWHAGPVLARWYNTASLGRRPEGGHYMLPDGEFEWSQRIECPRCWWTG